MLKNKQLTNKTFCIEIAYLFPGWYQFVADLDQLVFHYQAIEQVNKAEGRYAYLQKLWM